MMEAEERKPFDYTIEELQSVVDTWQKHLSFSIERFKEISDQVKTCQEAISFWSKLLHVKQKKNIIDLSSMIEAAREARKEMATNDEK